MTNTIRAIAATLLSLGLLASALVYEAPAAPATAAVAVQQAPAARPHCLYQWGPSIAHLGSCTLR